MATQKVYSPSKVVATWGSLLTFKGFAEGTAIQAQRSSDNSSNVVGMQGDVALTVNPDQTGTITFTLLQTSETNRILSGIQAAQDFNQELYRAGITIADPSGGYLLHAEGCHIMTPPEMALAGGDEQNSKVWVFFSENMKFLDTPVGVTEDAAIASRVKNAIDDITRITDQF